MTRRCPACGKKTDPLRAGHVAIFDERFQYFCDRGCREDWLQGGRPNRSSFRPPSIRPPSISPSRAPSLPPSFSLPAPPSLASFFSSAVSPSLPPVSANDPLPAVDAVDGPTEPESDPAPTFAPETEASPADPPADPNASLLAVGFACGLLGVTLLLAGKSSVIEAIRIAIAFAGWIALVVRAFAVRRDPADLHPLIVLSPGIIAVVASVYAWLATDPAHAAAATFAGIVVATAAATTYLVERGRKNVRHERHRLALALGAEEGWPSRLRAGETVLVEAGETVPVDGTVIEGEALVQPWPLASGTAKKREGDAVVAGARALEGSLRVLTSSSGADRAWARLSLDPQRRADVAAPLATFSQKLATRGAFVGAALMTLAGLANGATGVELVLHAITGFTALGLASVPGIAATQIARGLLEAHRRGIAYRSAVDWDRASRASVAVFSARGTLLLDAPELIDIDLFGPLDEMRVLALVAGAESAKLGDPIALAIHRAASARSVDPDAVRSPSPQPGLGMTAVASTGEPLVVGNRALMLREKVSIAVAEADVAKMEALGRTVLLVALGGKLIGALGLQDGLRDGARAAVQHLLDAQIEPVLLSGDARETCEAIGRALDIEHLRPEILPADRTREVSRLAGGGAIVAAIGRAGSDDNVLAAAGVSVALGGAGAATNDWGVSLAGDDVRDTALALTLAQRSRLQARTGLVLALAPGGLAALAVAFGVVAPAYVPLAGLVGALLATFHARATDTRKREAA